MDLSREGLMAIAAHEGIVLRPYLDSKNVWTLGVGHTKAAGHPDPAAFQGELTLSEALGLFRHDVSKYAAVVAKAIKVPLKQHEFDALVSFHYNTGAIGKASLTKSLNAGKKALAAKQFMNWTKPKEIEDRRTAEMEMFRDGKYPAPFASIFPVKANNKPDFAKGKRVDLRTAFAPPVAAPPARVEPVPAAETAPPPVNRVPEPAPVAKRGNPLAILLGVVVASIFAAWGWFISIPCNLIGIWC